MMAQDKLSNTDVKDHFYLGQVHHLCNFQKKQFFLLYKLVVASNPVLTWALSQDYLKTN